MVPIWAAAIAYKVYNEHLQLNHFIGMALLTACMACISLSNVLDQSTAILEPSLLDNEIEKLKFHPVTPVMLALAATLLLGINMNIVKYYD